MVGTANSESDPDREEDGMGTGVCARAWARVRACVDFGAAVRAIVRLLGRAVAGYRCFFLFLFFTCAVLEEEPW